MNENAPETFLVTVPNAPDDAARLIRRRLRSASGLEAATVRPVALGRRARWTPVDVAVADLLNAAEDYLSYAVGDLSASRLSPDDRRYLAGLLADNEWYAWSGEVDDDVIRQAIQERPHILGLRPCTIVAGLRNEAMRAR